MPSILPPRPTMMGSCSGCLNQSSRKIEQLTGMYMSDDSSKSSSKFLGINGRKKKKKDKKRPPPISVSVGSVNVFMANNTFNSFTSHDGYWTPPTPQTPPHVPCMKQLCKEVHDYLTTTPTFSQPKHHPDHIWPPRIMSSTMSSAELPAELPANPAAAIAELPAAEHSPQQTEELHELDASSSPSSPSSTSTIKIGGCKDTPPETPKQSPTPGPGPEMEKTWALTPTEVKGLEKNGKLLSSMNLEELLNIFPSLSIQEIEEHWRPLMVKECHLFEESVKTFRAEGPGLPEIPNHTGLRAYMIETPSENKERRNEDAAMDINRERKECKDRLLEKDAEIITIKTAHKSEVAILSSFISNQVPDVKNSSDPSATGVDAIIKRQSLKSEGGEFGAKYIFVPKQQHMEQILEIHNLQVQADDIESVAQYFENKLKTAMETLRDVRREAKTYKKSNAKLEKEIADKDLQIASLNNKVAQVMKMYPSHAHHHSVSGALYPSRYDKDLPSPKPSEWKRELEEKEREIREKEERKKFREEMLARVPAYLLEPGDLLDRRGEGQVNSGLEEDRVIDRFQTLSVDGEEFPFYLENDMSFDSSASIGLSSEAMGKE